MARWWWNGTNWMPFKAIWSHIPISRLERFFPYKFYCLTIKDLSGCLYCRKHSNVQYSITMSLELPNDLLPAWLCYFQWQCLCLLNFLLSFLRSKQIINKIWHISVQKNEIFGKFAFLWTLRWRAVVSVLFI